jgi:hypothetical protein
MDRLTVIQSALAVGAAGVLIWALTKREPAHVHAANAPLQSAAAPVDGVRVPVTLPAAPQRERVSAIEMAREPSAAEVFLEDYYKDDAAEVRAMLEAQGIDLATYKPPLPESEIRDVLPMWFRFESVEREARIKEMVAWPEGVTAEWVQDRFAMINPPDPGMVAVIDELAEVYNTDIKYAIEDYMDAVEAALQIEVQRGRVSLVPFVTRKLQPIQGEAFLRMVRAGAGWNATVRLAKHEHPAAVDARAAVYGLIENRDAILRDALFGL